MRGMRRALALSALLLLVGGVVSTDEPPPVPPFPDLPLYRLSDGEPVQLSSFAGRPVLLAFWASWCGPCRVELPELDRLQDELAPTGFALVTVNVDNHPAAGHRFLAALGIDVPVYRMNRVDLMRLGVSSLPTSLLLDREHRPVEIYEGYSPDVVREVRRLVEKMGPAPGLEAS